MPFQCGQELVIKQITADLWCLETDLVYFDSEHTNEVIIVPDGFICDGSSIPSFAWMILGHPLQGAHGPVGFLHDFLYRNKTFDRRTCDLIYLEGHEDLGTPAWRRHLCYTAVRLFGGISYSKNKES